MRTLKFCIITYLFAAFALGALGQDSVAYCIQGRVRDKVKERYIEGAIVTLLCDGGRTLRSTSDSLGNYMIRLRSNVRLTNGVLDVSATGLLSEGRKVLFGDDPQLCCNFDLHPLKFSTDFPWPDLFLFDAQSSNVKREDSLWLALAFSKNLNGKSGLSYSYVIEVRRASYESDDIAMKRGVSLKKLLVHLGVDADHIVIDNLSASDFYFFDSSGDSVFAPYLNERGLEVTQDLIDNTTDPVRREAYESMRRFAQIKIDVTKR